MNHDYVDIRSRIAEDPSWWDEFAVPRYGPFTPESLADIYARECALVLIRCQACSREFRVAMSVSHQPTGFLANEILQGVVFYGDPPNVDCCVAGPTMSSIPVRVLEYWADTGLSVPRGWTRNTSLELDLEDAEP
jgi:hypothetical protein